MMERGSILWLVLAGVSIIAAPTSAEIVQPQITPQYGFGDQILSMSPIGQTFTSEDTKITYIGFAIFDMNPQLPIVPINVELFEGEGTDGTLLGTMPLQTSSDPLSLPDFLSSGNPRFLEADFSFATLNVGQIYTALLTTSNAQAGIYGEYWKNDIDGSVLQPDLYTGGYGFNYETQSPSYKGEFDLVFRATSVPEPAALILFALGGLILRRRR